MQPRWSQIVQMSNGGVALASGLRLPSSKGRGRPGRYGDGIADDNRYSQGSSQTGVWDAVPWC